MATTAKVECTRKQDSGDQVTLEFQADYKDGRNKEWAEYTPALSITMTLKKSVAVNFNVGDAFLLTFEKED